MSRTLIAIFALLALSSASLAASKPWTVMYYVVVDERTLQSELDAVKRIPASITDPTKVNAVLQWDTHKDPAGRYVANARKWEQMPEKVPDNMGDPVTLFQFVEWAMKNYPAERYILFIGGHGSGFEDKWGPGSLADQARPTDWFRADLAARAGLSTPAQKDPTGDSGKGTAYDYDDHDCLTVQEISVVLEEIQKRHLGGKKLDILAYSSCWQMNLESIYEYQDLVRYIVACETVSYSGTPLFYGFLPTLCKDPQIPAGELAARIIKDYIHGADSAQTIASIDTDLFRRVAMALDRMSVELLRVYRNPKNHKVDGAAFRSVIYADSDHHQNQERFVDVSTLADNVIGKKTGFVPTAMMNQAAVELRAALKDSVKLWRREPYTASNALCVSVFLPKRFEDLAAVQAHLAELSIVQETHWDEFLQAHKGKGYNHAAALASELSQLALRARRIAQLDDQMASLEAGSAARVIADRERSHLASVRDQAVQLLADVTRGEIEDGDSGLSDLATAAERLDPADCAIVQKMLADMTGGVSLTLTTLQQTAPERAAKLAAELSRLQAALARTGAPGSKKDPASR